MTAATDYEAARNERRRGKRIHPKRCERPINAGSFEHAMGHVWSDGDAGPYRGGETMRCTNSVQLSWGERAECRRSFAEHQLEPVACALVKWKAEA